MSGSRCCAIFLLAVEAFHEERRMNTIIVGHGKVTCHLVILSVHIVGTIVAGPFVLAIGHLIIIQFCIIFLCARQTVDYRDIEWRISGGIAQGCVIHDAIAIHICLVAVHGIETPGVLLGIPETGAIRTLDQNLALAVAVDVVNGNHIVLTGIDVHVRSHIHGPEAGAICLISLQHVAGSLCRTGGLRRR